MGYLIGIDGGGTKTHCIIADDKLNIIHEEYGGPSNFLLIGTEAVCKTIFSLIDECGKNKKIKFEEIDGIVLGTTGAGRRSDAELLEDSFIAYLGTKNKEIKMFRVESDARIALEGAFPGSPGSILIAGTGSIMFGKDSSGTIHRAGGFGRFIGDEGSGYSIGRKGLSAIAKEFDGRGEKTILTKLMKENFKIDTPEALITKVYKNNFDIASAAPLVLEAAKRKDEVCLAILNKEVDELLSHIKTMQKKLREPSLKVAFIGGLISEDNIFSKMLKEKVKAVLPEAEIRKPAHSPAYGAVLMANALKK